MIDLRRTIVKRCVAICAAFLAFAAFSCTMAPPPSPAPPPPSMPIGGAARILPAPVITRAEGFGDRLELTWLTHRTPRDVVAGYNVYISSTPGADRLAGNDSQLLDCLLGGTAYPGDTDGIIDSESVIIAPVTRGARYYLHVRTAFPGGTQGPPSAEREVIARPRGVLTLRPRFAGAGDGFSFSEDRNVSSLSDSNDVYLFAMKDGLFLGSPARLNPLLRSTRLSDLGPSDSIDDFPDCPRQGFGDEKVAVIPGHTILVVTEDGRMAKLRPQDPVVGSDTSSVAFDYLFQPIAGEARF
ncbi:MAG: hypothetical protein HZB43_00480 [candidate division Zixibacteria bacterium]|nr:hypothetical protein [candidate division Zixibacteria bacterium]